MNSEHPLFVSVLCRTLNYSYFDFMNFVSKERSAVFREVFAREECVGEQCNDLIKKINMRLEETKSFTIIHPTHAAYPERFRNLDRAPVFLCTQGDLELLDKPLLTVIGSRRALPQFMDWMNTEFVHFLKTNDVVTVSGGAYGIDCCATKMALFSGRSSILILPSGFARPYPAHVGRWLDNKNVLSLSEYFPNESVRNYHFVHRNRLLGAISTQLFVAQCAIRSGSMTTVKYTLEAGGDVMTLPSFPGIIESGGNIQLLKDGAQLISQAKDLELSMRMFTPHPNC
jgi:DNA processing protein